MPTLTFFLNRLPTPLGQMLVVTDHHGRLRAIDWHDHEDRMMLLMRRQYKNDAILLRETQQLTPATHAMREYFAGNLAAIEGLATETGGTDFQRQVWTALREIPSGKTLSYLDLATRIGKPLAVRAVGLANGANPIGIVVPCHRIVGSDRSLTGYGGGLHRKQWLLEHESAWGQAHLL